MQFSRDLATGPPPLPPYPSVFHHGTDYETSAILQTAEIEARGEVDFGAGFYTHTKENWQLAKQWAIRISLGKRAPGWGVVTFPIPPREFRRGVRRILEYRSTTDVPANAPIDPDTGRQMNWREFVRYNVRKRDEGNLPTWPQYDIIRGPLWGTLAETDIRQVSFTESGAPVLNQPAVKSLRILVRMLFRR
jgi:hypothetical protein